MTEIQQIARAAELRVLIAHHDRAYFEKDSPEISDLDYDELVAELQSLEAANPALAKANSPTQRVGGKAGDDFDIVKHDPPLLSLDKIRARDAAKKMPRFFSKVKKAGSRGVRITPKLDGLAVVLHYEGGELVCAATRGDGREGEDITHSIRFISGVPSQIEEQGKIQVRGEAVIKRDDFARLQEVRAAAGEPEFANPRNAAAGLVRQKDPNGDYLRLVSFCAYSLIGGRNREAMDELTELGGLGFVFPDGFYCETAEECLSYFADNHRRSVDGVDMDGWVLQADDLNVFAAMGCTARAPRGAVAYKFEDAGVQTKLNAVEWQVGRTGTITPVAILEPVEVGGVVVSKATLHNCQHIRELGLAIGDEVEVIRSGDVIPKIVGVSRKDNSGIEVEVPRSCPSCSAAVIPQGADLKCSGHDCLATRLAVFKHFVSRSVFNIKGIADQTLIALIGQGLVQYPADIFRLTAKDIASAESAHSGGMEVGRGATKKAQAIEKAKKTTLDRVLASIGIEGLGNTASKALARREDAVEFLQTATEEDLVAIEGINKTAAKNIVKYFQGAENGYVSCDHIQRLKAYGVEWESESLPPVVVDGLLAGQVVLVTGALESLTRDQVKGLIESHGGKPASSVSSKVDLLVVGENPGPSKLEKASNLGLKQVEGRDFLSQLRGSAYAS